MPHTYYEILGVSEQATNLEIEAAFKSKATEIHPDRISPTNPYLRNVAAEAFKSLSEAKTVLLDASKRQKYDAELAYSRGASPKPPSAPDSPTPGESASCVDAPPAAPALTPRQPNPFSWLGNTPRGLIALTVGCGALLLAGGIALHRASSAVNPPPMSTTTNLAGSPGSADACESRAAGCNSGSAGTRPANAPESSQLGKRAHTIVNPQIKAGLASRSKSSPTAKPRTMTLWRASEPPDLSALSSSERQAIETACSYAKQMESPEAYNGCLTKELALRSHK